jgi:hypothetical protein
LWGEVRITEFSCQCQLLAQEKSEEVRMSLLGVERGPKGQESLAQGLPWAKLSWPVWPKTDSTHFQAAGKRYAKLLRNSPHSQPTEN